MIVSVSRRTDIPAFYAEWFMNRIRDGYALVRNPFFPGNFTRVDLHPDAVDAIVFVTRNPAPLMTHLDELEGRGYRFCFQMTITGYPSLLEPHVIAVDDAIRFFKDLSHRMGPEKIIWRFDPILLSSLTPEDHIAANFSAIARELQGSTDRVIISFTDFYKKAIVNFRRITASTNVSFSDLHQYPDRLFELAGRISEISRRHHMQIFSCAEKYDFSSVGIKKGKCVDAEYLSRIAGAAVRGTKAKNQRKDCCCDESRDIGQYDTCLHGCVYCYATKNYGTALKNRKLHNPLSPLLIGEYPVDEEEGVKGGQLCLFGTSL